MPCKSRQHSFLTWFSFALPAALCLLAGYGVMQRGQAAWDETAPWTGPAKVLAHGVDGKDGMAFLLQVDDAWVQNFVQRFDCREDAGSSALEWYARPALQRMDSGAVVRRFYLARSCARLEGSVCHHGDSFLFALAETDRPGEVLCLRLQDCQGVPTERDGAAPVQPAFPELSNASLFAGDAGSLLGIVLCALCVCVLLPLTGDSALWLFAGSPRGKLRVIAWFVLPALLAVCLYLLSAADGGNYRNAIQPLEVAGNALLCFLFALAAQALPCSLLLRVARSRAARH